MLKTGRGVFSLIKWMVVFRAYFSCVPSLPISNWTCHIRWSKLLSQNGHHSFQNITLYAQSQYQTSGWRFSWRYECLKQWTFRFLHEPCCGGVVHAWKAAWKPFSNFKARCFMLINGCCALLWYFATLSFCMKWLTHTEWINFYLYIVQSHDGNPFCYLFVLKLGWFNDYFRDVIM